MLPPSSHTTGRTVRYPAVHETAMDAISLPSPSFSATQQPPCEYSAPEQPKAGSARLPLSWPYLRMLLRHRLASRSALLLPCFMFGPSPLRFRAATTTSAAICQPIPTPYGVSSPRQANRLPRVIRATFTAYIRRIYVPTFRMVSGFECCGPLAQMGPPISAGCSSDRSFAYSFLQIPPHDGHPCCSASSSHHQGLQGTLTPKSTK